MAQMDFYNIGEFSRMCGLPVKTLRFYHEKGLLTPASVDPHSGYRSYDGRNVETAHVIVALKKLGFPLNGIAKILAGHGDDADILEFLERRKSELQGEISERRDILQTLEHILARERSAREIMKNTSTKIEEKSLAPLLVGGIRTTGKYSDCGKLFSQLGRKLGRHIGGKALLLCYDEEYKEEGADFECCMPLRKRVEVDGLDIRELPGGRCVSLIHSGPYDELSRSYGRALAYIKERGLTIQSPCREVYLKGPGIIFKGNPKKYLTELQFPVESAR